MQLKSVFGADHKLCLLWRSLSNDNYSVILISRLLLRMHRTYLYVASFVWTSTKNEVIYNAYVVTRVWIFHLSQFNNACFDHLPRKTYTKHSVCAKRFDLRSMLPALRNLWLLLDIKLNYLG